MCNRSKFTYLFAMWSTPTNQPPNCMKMGLSTYKDLEYTVGAWAYSGGGPIIEELQKSPNTYCHTQTLAFRKHRCKV